MSNKSRKLTENSKVNENVPMESYFDYGVSKSSKKIRRKECNQQCKNCLNTCGDYCQKCCEFCCKWSCIGIVILLVLSFFVKDIVIIVFNVKNNCNDALNSNRYNFAFDITEWCWIGAISHLICSVLVCCCFVFVAIGLDMDIGKICTFCTICCVWVFFVVWLVIGFLLHTEMTSDTREEEECTLTVLYWCIFQSIECGIIPCIVSLIIWFSVSVERWDREERGGMYSDN